jgi:heavy metal translocating P-type ATPase
MRAKAMRKILSFFRNYGEFSIALIATIVALIFAAFGLWTIAHWILGVAATILALPLIWDMIQDIRTGIYGVDILAATAIITSVVLHQFWAGIVIVLMLTGGESLEDYAEQRAKTELDALLKRAPKQAHVYRGRKVVDVSVSAVTIGTKVVVLPGEVVPVDGIILEEAGTLDESSLTGESLPQIREVNDEILSGSVCLERPITIKATHSAADSQYEQIIRLVKAASNSQAPFVRLADKYSIPFTIIAFGIAGAAWILSRDSIRFLDVLVVATPCPLILAAPIAVISGMSRSAQEGIIIKTGGTLEMLASARSFAFDKTGTLTHGKPVVDTVQVFGSHSEEQVIQVAAALEQNSNHVLAAAVIAYAATKQLRLPHVKKTRELPGHGLSATVNGKHITVGRFGLLQDYDVELPHNFKPDKIQKTAAFVAIDNKLAGLITFSDEIRKETPSTLKRLRQFGIKNILMVTGDNQAAANIIAKKLGIKQVRAEALPGDKIAAIEAIPEKLQPVVFVGDGVNDAPVLTASHVGIALGARGSTAASESADIVIMNDDLALVARGVEIAKRTFFIARQSILIGIFLSIVLMVIFAFGKFRPLYGAIVQELVDVVVIFNALRAHRIVPKSKTVA